MESEREESTTDEAPLRVQGKTTTSTYLEDVSTRSVSGGSHEAMFATNAVSLCVHSLVGGEHVGKHTSLCMRLPTCAVSGGVIVSRQVP